MSRPRPDGRGVGRCQCQPWRERPALVAGEPAFVPKVLVAHATAPFLIAMAARRATTGGIKRRPDYFSVTELSASTCRGGRNGHGRRQGTDSWTPGVAGRGEHPAPDPVPLPVPPSAAI